MAQANGEADCAIVAVPWVAPSATNARVDPNKDRSRVRRGESGPVGIGACALSEIASASQDVSLASESSSESRQACKVGDMVGLGLDPSWIAVAEAFLVKAQAHLCSLPR